MSVWDIIVHEMFNGVVEMEMFNEVFYMLSLYMRCSTDELRWRAVIEIAQRKCVKYEAKCADLGYGFLPFSFSSFGELEKDAVIFVKQIRRFFVTQDIGARAAVHIFNRTSFAIARGQRCMYMMVMIIERSAVKCKLVQLKKDTTTISMHVIDGNLNYVCELTNVKSLINAAIRRSTASSVSMYSMSSSNSASSLALSSLVGLAVGNQIGLVCVYNFSSISKEASLHIVTTLGKMFARCLTTRVNGHDQPPLQIMQILCIPPRRSTRLTPPTPIPTVAKEIEKMVEGTKNVKNDEVVYYVLNNQNDPDTRLDPMSCKESPEVKIIADSFFDELQGRYGYLFRHLKTRFLARKKFNLLAQHLQEVMEEALPNMVDDHVKELTKTQVPLYVAEGLIMERKHNQSDVAKMIADAIQQEHESHQE
nr:hypothetical protein [Tanacetum cinerariifolium]